MIDKSRRALPLGFGCLLLLTGMAVASIAVLGTPAPRHRPPSDLTLAAPALGASTCGTFAPNRVDDRHEVELDLGTRPALPYPVLRTGRWQGELTGSVRIVNRDNRGAPSVQSLAVYLVNAETDEVVGVVDAAVSTPPLAPDHGVQAAVRLGVRGCEDFWFGRGSQSPRLLLSSLPPGRYDAIPVGSIVQRSADPIYASIVGGRVRFDVAGGRKLTAPAKREPCGPEDAALGVIGVIRDAKVPHSFASSDVKPARPAELVVGIAALHLTERQCRLRTEGWLRADQCDGARVSQVRVGVDVDLPESHLSTVGAVSMRNRCPAQHVELRLLQPGGMESSVPKFAGSMPEPDPVVRPMPRSAPSPAASPPA